MVHTSGQTSEWYKSCKVLCRMPPSRFGLAALERYITIRGFVPGCCRLRGNGTGQEVVLSHIYCFKLSRGLGFECTSKPKLSGYFPRICMLRMWTAWVTPWYPDIHTHPRSSLLEAAYPLHIVLLGEETREQQTTIHTTYSSDGSSALN